MHMTTKSGKNKVKYNLFEQTKDCKKTFQNLKQVFITAPVLAYFDFELETWVESNFSDFVTVDIFSQVHNKELRPIAYFSKKLTPAECNYIIYNKELLAIVKSFEIWCPELANTIRPVKVYTDHRNLKYFMTTKQLIRQQAR